MLHVCFYTDKVSFIGVWRYCPFAQKECFEEELCFIYCLVLARKTIIFHNVVQVCKFWEGIGSVTVERSKRGRLGIENILLKLFICYTCFEFIAFGKIWKDSKVIELLETKWIKEVSSFCLLSTYRASVFLQIFARGIIAFTLVMTKNCIFYFIVRFVVYWYRRYGFDISCFEQFFWNFGVYIWAIPRQIAQVCTWSSQVFSFYANL